MNFRIQRCIGSRSARRAMICFLAAISESVRLLKVGLCLNFCIATRTLPILISCSLTLEVDGVKEPAEALHPGVDELFIDRGVQSFSLKFLTVPTFLKKTVKCSNDPDRVNKLTGRGIIAYFPSKSSWSSWVCNLDRHVRDDRDIPHTTCGQ